MISDTNINCKPLKNGRSEEIFICTFIFKRRRIEIMKKVTSFLVFNTLHIRYPRHKTDRVALRDSLEFCMLRKKGHLLQLSCLKSGQRGEVATGEVVIMMGW